MLLPKFMELVHDRQDSREIFIGEPEFDMNNRSVMNILKAYFGNILLESVGSKSSRDFCSQKDIS